MENERAALTDKLQRNEDEKVALEGVVRERDERITLLEHQLQVVKDSEQWLLNQSASIQLLCTRS